jgi:hypothetical protein
MAEFHLSIAGELVRCIVFGKIDIMKQLLAIAMVGAALFAPDALQAQNYSIDWYTIGGGGGSSAGTNGGTTYSVTGTIGQTGTAGMSGGSYTVTGGFWSVIASVQTPGAPLLSITRSGNQAVISWSASATGFVLQQTSNLATTPWGASSAPLTTNGATISVTVPAGSGYQFFRLQSP